MAIGPALRITTLAATLLALLALTGCGASAVQTLPVLEPPHGLRVAASDALTLRGIALDSCSAWRLVSIAAQRNDAVLGDEWFGVAQKLAARYITVHGRYDEHRRALPPSMFLPPFDSLIRVEEGTCWI